MKYFKTPPQHKKKNRVMWCFGAAALLLFILFSVGYTRIGALASSVPGSDAAARWTSEDSSYPFAQLSAYFDSYTSFSLDTLYGRRMELSKQLEQSAITAANEDARLYLDCFSGETSLTVSTDRASVSVTATAAGGDFFYFHPMTLRSGSYFAEGDAVTNTIVLDEYAAWQLFGAVDVAGLEVTISGQPFRVVGVTQSPKDPTAKIAYGATPRVCVNYLGLRLVTGYDTITCYEVLLPNPIKSFASNIIKSVFSISDGSQNAALYDATTRFDYEALVSEVPDFFARAMRMDRVIPAWWENVARVAEYRAIAIAAVSAVIGVLAVISFVVFVSLWFYIHPIRIKNIYLFFDAKIDKQRMKRWRKRMAAKASKEEKAAMQTAVIQSQNMPEDGAGGDDMYEDIDLTLLSASENPDAT